MTPKQAAVVGAIRTLSAGGVIPTYREIAKKAGIASIGGLAAIIDQLCADGILTRERNRFRTVKIVEGPTREAMERWSDEEVVRIHGIAFDIISDRARREAVSA